MERRTERTAEWAHGVVVSHPLRMRKALGSIPSVSNLFRARWKYKRFTACLASNYFAHCWPIAFQHARPIPTRRGLATAGRFADIKCARGLPCPFPARLPAHQFEPACFVRKCRAARLSMVHLPNRFCGNGLKRMFCLRLGKVSVHDVNVGDQGHDYSKYCAPVA